MRSLMLSLVLGAATIAPVVSTPVPAKAQDLGDAITGIAQSLLTQELDRTAYSDAQRSNTAAAYRGYLSRFPRGMFRAEAEAALVRLGAAVETPAPVTPVNPVNPVPGTASPAAIEAALNLTRNDRLDIQRQLTALGHDTYGADGLWGTNTRNAISRWQRANGQAVTGYVTRAEVTLIGRQAAGLTTPTRPTEPTAGAEQAERALGLSVSERREVQLRLTLLGFDTQGTNGTFGTQTRRAVAEWQRSQNDTATGFLTADQIRALQRQTRG